MLGGALTARFTRHYIHRYLKNTSKLDHLNEYNIDIRWDD